MHLLERKIWINPIRDRKQLRKLGSDNEHRIADLRRNDGHSRSNRTGSSAGQNRAWNSVVGNIDNLGTEIGEPALLDLALVDVLLQCRETLPPIHVGIRHELIGLR